LDETWLGKHTTFLDNKPVAPKATGLLRLLFLHSQKFLNQISAPCYLRNSDRRGALLEQGHRGGMIRTRETQRRITMRKFTYALSALAIVVGSAGLTVGSSAPAQAADIWQKPIIIKWPNGKTYRCHKNPSGTTSCTQV
jgi:hypothetical protein